MIHRVNDHKKAYFTVYNKTAADPRLSWKATGLLIYLLSLPPKWKICKEQLIKVHTDGRTSTCAAFDELVKAGYIEWQNNEWQVYETPKDAQTTPPKETLNTDVSHQQYANHTSKNDELECRISTFKDVENQHLVSNKKKVSKKEGIPSTPLSCSEEHNNQAVGGANELVIEDDFNDSNLEDQVKAILVHYPNTKNLSYGIPAIKKRIAEVGFDKLLEATKRFAATMKEENKAGSQASYFFGEEAHYLAWLPVPKEPLQPREFNEPSDMSSEEVEDALAVMEDALWVFYTQRKPDYVAKHIANNNEDFREGARICFYNNYNPRTYVASALECNAQYHSPMLLHSEEAVARHHRFTNQAIVEELTYVLSKDVATCADLVATEMRQRDLGYEEVLLDEATSIPAWFRVSALSADSPRLGEMQAKWGREGRLEIYDMQFANAVEVLFVVEGLHAANLFPFYAKRYTRPPAATRRSELDGVPEPTLVAPAMGINDRYHDLLDVVETHAVTSNPVKDDPLPVAILELPAYMKRKPAVKLS